MYYNQGILTKFMLRRERLSSTLWVVITAIFMGILAVGLGTAMDAASRAEMAVVMENPAMIAMMGPIIGADNFTVGAMFTSFMLVFTAIAIATMNIMLVIKHTRGDEEKGRYEVLRSLPVGRASNLVAIRNVVIIVNGALSLLTGLALFAFGDYSMDITGSLLWALLLWGIGIFFGGVAALFSQLSSSSRGAMGYSFLTMGVLYMMRAVGDVSAEVLSLISPLGLIIRAEAYVSNNFSIVIWLILMTLPVWYIAERLNLKRDIDQGILPDRLGKAYGGRLLKTPFGLTLKLQKVSLIVGGITIFLIAASYGTIMGDIDGFIETNEFYQQLIMWMDGISMPLMFAGMINFMAAMMALIPMLLYILKIRSEEKDGRSELIIATPVSRYKYILGYVVIAIVSSVVLQIVTALGLWSAAVSVLPDPTEFPLDIVLRANLLYLPALWVMIGLAVMLIGVLPNMTNIVIWSYYGFVLFMGMFGRMDILPSWTANLSPFGFIPQYPMENIEVYPLVILSILAIMLMAIGVFGFKNRDIK